MNKFGVAAAMIVAAVGAAAQASPVINGAAINARVFNDNPNSVLNTTNAYPALVQFAETNFVDGGFANLHNFRLSDNGGTSDAIFANGDAFAVFTNVTLSTAGGANVEGGLQVAPWWSQADGRFNLRTSDGEIACFGGRLPFYSFTGNHGFTYTAGTTAQIGVEYDPQSLNAGAPGRIRYYYSNGANSATSPWLNFDMGNPAEDPPYGLYGMLNGARVGGYVQTLGILPGGSQTATFEGTNYMVPAPGSVALLGLAGLAAARRRR